ncbi:hypothetical protein N0V93_009370 [Gnomoniopsis smithogilvyi]|uniref:Ig-like domain-containing protein n=1 Tax=Gnomoniopsis smithogilvyi TaxID=1191159 RepID=A0A9W9CTL2_9PEZI|nr:hypothetical protein N0V93_009370 [Gnomoniopsis smithogilvyi]
MLAFTTLSLALGLVPTAFAAPTSLAARTTTSGTITGSGTIQVVANTTSHSISWSAGSPSQSVACLNAVGQVVLDDCAVFTAEGNHVSTSAGVCSFQNTSQPTNTDDVYGENVHAFLCWDHEASSKDVQFYTVGGMQYNFLGQGDANLYYDVPSLPITPSDAIDFWYFVWGGEQTSVPQGHYQALLLWEPTS